MLRLFLRLNESVPEHGIEFEVRFQRADDQKHKRSLTLHPVRTSYNRCKVEIQLILILLRPQVLRPFAVYVSERHGSASMSNDQSQCEIISRYRNNNSNQSKSLGNRNGVDFYEEALLFIM